MQIYEQANNKDEWEVSISPLSMESREGSETEYRLSIQNDLDPQRTISIADNSSDSSSISRTCQRRDLNEKKQGATPWSARDASLGALASLFEQQMKRRVSRRVAAAAAATAKAAVVAEDAIPLMETNKFTLKIKDAIPIPAKFSWLFKFEDEDHCLLLNTCRLGYCVGCLSSCCCTCR